MITIKGPREPVHFEDREMRAKAKRPVYIEGMPLETEVTRLKELELTKTLEPLEYILLYLKVNGKWPPSNEDPLVALKVEGLPYAWMAHIATFAKKRREDITSTPNVQNTLDQIFLSAWRGLDAMLRRLLVARKRLADISNMSKSGETINLSVRETADHFLDTLIQTGQLPDQTTTRALLTTTWDISAPVAEKLLSPLRELSSTYSANTSDNQWLRWFGKFSEQEDKFHDGVKAAAAAAGGEEEEEEEESEIRARRKRERALEEQKRDEADRRRRRREEEEREDERRRQAEEEARTKAQAERERLMRIRVKDEQDEAERRMRKQREEEEERSRRAEEERVRRAEEEKARKAAEELERIKNPRVLTDKERQAMEPRREEPELKRFRVQDNVMLQVEMKMVGYARQALQPLFLLIGMVAKWRDMHGNLGRFYRWTHKGAPLEDRQNPMKLGSATFDEFVDKNRHMGAAFLTLSYLLYSQLRTEAGREGQVSVQFALVGDEQREAERLDEAISRVIETPSYVNSLSFDWMISTMDLAIFSILLDESVFAAVVSALEEINLKNPGRNFTLKEMMLSPGVRDKFAFMISTKPSILAGGNAYMKSARVEGGRVQGSNFYVSQGIKTREAMNDLLLTAYFFFERVYRRPNPVAEEARQARAEMERERQSLVRHLPGQIINAVNTAMSMSIATRTTWFAERRHSLAANVQRFHDLSEKVALYDTMLASLTPYILAHSGD
jgi:hypothetical protein